MLQHSLSFIVLYLLIAQLGFAQDCKTLAANKPSTLVRGTDAIASSTGKMSSVEMAKMKPHLAKAENWTKKILTNFTGAKLLYYNDLYPRYLPDSVNTDNMFVTTGIRSHYSSKMMLFAYYCYDNNSTIHTEAESGSTITVQFNNVFAFGFTADAGVYTINGKKAFKTIQKKHSEGRIDFYELRTQNNATAKMFTANDYIILRNSDEPLFIPVTRKEYLQQMLKDVEAFKTSQIASAKLAYTPANEAANKTRFEEELKRIDNSKNYTKEQMAPYRKRFIETWETEKQKFDKRISKIETETSQSQEVLQEYLKKPQEWLTRHVKNFYHYSSYTQVNIKSYMEDLDKSYLNGEEETHEEIVSVNPAYFNKTLSPDVPQVIMVHLRNGTYAHMEKVAALVKQPGTLAALEAIFTF